MAHCWCFAGQRTNISGPCGPRAGTLVEIERSGRGTKAGSSSVLRFFLLRLFLSSSHARAPQMVAYDRSQLIDDRARLLEDKCVCELNIAGVGAVPLCNDHGSACGRQLYCELGPTRSGQHVFMIAAYNCCMRKGLCRRREPSCTHEHCAAASRPCRRLEALIGRGCIHHTQPCVSDGNHPAPPCVPDGRPRARRASARRDRTASRLRRSAPAPCALPAAPLSPPAATDEQAEHEDSD